MYRDAVASAPSIASPKVAAYAAELTRGAIMDLAGHDPDVQRERADGSERSCCCGIPRHARAVASRFADVTVFRRDVLVAPD